MAEIAEKTKLKGRGGPGRGGGRKMGKTALLGIKMREMLAVELNKRFKPIVEAQLDAAEGIQTEEYSKKTGELFYKSPGPDVQAFRNVFDQVAGRATERVEVSGRDGIPLIIRLDS